MSLSIGNVAGKYLYSDSKTGQTRVNLDTSADGVWSKSEVENYAADLQAVGGKALDTKAIFDTYDSDKSGTLDHSEYDKALSAGALGAEELATLQDAAEAALAEITTKDEDGSNSALTELLSTLDLDASTVAELIGEDGTDSTAESEDTSESTETTSLADYMASLSDAERLSWIKSTFQAETTTSLIESMLDPDAALSSLSSLFSQYGTVSEAAEAQSSSLLDTLA